MSLPGAPNAPYMTASVEATSTTANITLAWNPLMDTGGVPLTGYKLYQLSVSTGTTTLAYDGTNQPAVLTALVAGLTFGQQYTFWLTGLNPQEGPASSSVTLTAAGFPDAPGAITEVSNSRTGTSIGLQWSAPASDGGSPVISYTMVSLVDNQQN